jgi:peptide methionine sulfoxide reductase msrA/msrB
VHGAPFEKLEGVVAVTGGYTGGTLKTPTCEGVSSGRTGHVEAVEILFDPGKINYERLLDVYWRNIDPTDDDGQFVDRGDQYHPAIFYHGAEQEHLARESRDQIRKSGRFDAPILVQIAPADPFYPAEEYHQDYYLKNPVRYHYYRWASGRDRYLDDIWGKDREK